MKKIVHISMCVALMCCLLTGCASDNADTSSDSSAAQTEEAEDASTQEESDEPERLSDSDLESIAVQTLYQTLLGLEEEYGQFDAKSCRYEIANIEHDGSGGVEIYGRVAFYDKYGGRVDFGGDYTRNFTVHTTEWGGSSVSNWCELE